MKSLSTAMPSLQEGGEKSGVFVPYHGGTMIVNEVDAVINGTLSTGGKLVSEKLKTGQWSCWTGARHSCVAVSTRYFTQANVAPVV